MTIDCSVPRHLMVMRSLNGLTETPGSANNPKIMTMRDWIACTYADMKDYCELYTGDDVAWCGLTAAFCMTVAGVRPPFGPTDTDRFLWALSWADDQGYDVLDKPILGCVVVLERSGGGGHVTFYESTSGSNYMCRGGNQSDQVNLAPQAISNVVALVWPQGVPKPGPGPGPGPGPSPDEHPTIAQGDKGPAVVSVQTSLGLPPSTCDGDFGSITDGAVRGYQAACGLAADGVVGPKTWAALDELDQAKAEGNDGLPQAQIDAIIEIAENSAIARYSWRDRGVAPKGYTAGAALCFALAAMWLAEGDDTAFAMAQADRDDADKDALSWYRAKFKNLGMDNSEDGIDTLRHLFVMILGLGMRESSGRYCEGRDMSASNTSSTEAEAGMFQTSWNIKSCSSEIPPLLTMYWENPNGFLSAFQHGVSPDSNDLGNYGSGDGARYQFLSKFAPAFHAFVTAIGMRYLRQHWGPINRSEVELRKEANTMLLDVQDYLSRVA